MCYLIRHVFSGHPCWRYLLIKPPRHKTVFSNLSNGYLLIKAEFRHEAFEHFSPVRVLTEFLPTTMGYESVG
ncbi:hypothetical protein SUGI_1015370 [Cryptomeria japonica]|nr:hypothetical protein SUGI_1015370 [Cryptomeria japonica]